MFERLTDQARRAVVLAQEEARMLNHNYIGTEHILLGLIHEGECVAAKTLKSLGISLDAVRQQVEEIIGQGQQAPSGHIPFTPRAKKVLELSSREARQLGRNYIGTEHLLLGLIREGEGVAAQVLVRLGADLHRVRQQVTQLLHGQDVEARHSEPQMDDPPATGGLPVVAPQIDDIPEDGDRQPSGRLPRNLGTADSTDAGTGAGRRYYRVVISRDRTRWLPAISVTAHVLPVSDPARRVVARARQEATNRSHNYVGTEHILLSLIVDHDSAGTKALESLGISSEAVRQQVDEIIGAGRPPALFGLARSIPPTPRARKVLELSRREALRLSAPSVGTEHVLLGLIREGEGVAAQVLVRMGADLRRVRRLVLDGPDPEKPDDGWVTGW